MLTCARNGRNIAGTDLRDDAAPAWWDPTGWFKSDDAAAAPSSTPEPSSDGTGWDILPNAIQQAQQYSDLSTCQANYNQCVDTSNKCTAYVNDAAAAAKWSVKKPAGIAVAIGGVVLGTIVGVAIGRSSGKHATAVSGRRRRY
jgi:hypothetical protein